jgi:hypothetical protein
MPPEHTPVETHEPITPAEHWLDEDEELPRRPRRRLLRPLPLSLLGVLLIACGFIGGVLVEKGETSSSSSGTGAAAGGALASRFAALRSSAGAGTNTGSSGGPGAGAGGFARPTAGTVAYLDGSTLYVTNAEGNTVKVSTSQATTVTKTVKSDTKGIHPGETVTIVGSATANGALNAESISVGSSAGGGLAGLFGRSGAGTASGGAGGSSSGSSGAAPSLFGSG